MKSKIKSSNFYQKQACRQQFAIMKIIGIILLLILNFSEGFAQDFTRVGYLQYWGIKDIDILRASPTFANIDGDNDLDLYVGGGESEVKVFVFTNDGNGNFIGPTVLQADGSDIWVGYRSAPVFADIDGDSDLDLYIGTTNGNVSIFINDGSGNFTAAGYLQADGSNIHVGNSITPTFADIDGDSDLDLYIGEGEGNIKLFTNDGSGNFSSAGNLQADGSDIDIGFGSAPVFADIDGDSDLDLYVGEGGVGYINVFTNDGSGNFSSAGNLQADGSDIDVGFGSAPTFADIDGDSDLDLYVGEGDDGYINIFINDGSGNFSSVGNLQADGSDIDVGNNATLVFSDIDGDSNLDLYVGDLGGYIYIFTNDGSGNYTAAGNLQADGLDINVSRYSVPAFADIDGDSDLDLYVGEEYGYINFFINDGSGNFTTAGNLQADGSDIDIGFRSAPVFADIDGDSDLDLYVGEEDGNINIFTNDGSGNFSIAGNLQTAGSEIDIGFHSAPVFADIDGDSDLDLYVGEEDGNINIFINDGSGNYTAAGNLQADGSDIHVGNSATPVFADINGSCGVELYIGNSHGRIDVYSQDISAPEITSTHDDQIIGNGIVCEASIPDYTGNVVASDNCNANIDVTQSPTAGTTISGVINQVKLTVTDDAGNSDEVLFNVEVEDNIDPTITSTHNNQTIDANNNCEASLPDYTGDVVTSDNCDENLDVTQSPTSGTTISGTTNLVALTVTDNAGNSDEVLFNVEVEDNTAPQITSTHDDQIIGNGIVCEASLPDYSGDIVASDNCDANLDVTQSPTAGTTISGTTNQVTLTVTDDAGNSNEVLFNVEVEDNTDPVPDITTLSDLTAECTVSTPTTPTATDNCEGSITGTTTTIFPVTTQGTTIITWTYDDGNGNIVTQNQNVIITDAIDPVPDVANLSDLTGECSVAAPTSPTATDNCEGAVAGTTTTIFPVTTQGTTVVTWSYDDGNGNISTQTQNVIITDVTDPTITCIGNQTINLTVGQTAYIVSGTEFDPTATDDNCGIASIDNNFNDSNTLNGAQIPVGITTIVWTITDNSGNIETCSFEVTVNANTTGIEQLSALGISIYPNPSNGIFNLKFDNNNIQKIIIVNLDGKIIIEKTNVRSKETVDLTKYKSGIYIVSILTNKEIFTTKILKE